MVYILPEHDASKSYSTLRTERHRYCRRSSSSCLLCEWRQYMRPTYSSHVLQPSHHLILCSHVRAFLSHLMFSNRANVLISSHVLQQSSGVFRRMDMERCPPPSGL